MIKLKHSLNFDKLDSNYILLKEIFKIIDLIKSEQIITLQGINNIKKIHRCFKNIILPYIFWL